MTDERVEAVERLAAAQFGLFTSRDACRIGVSPAMLHHHCSTGRWRKVAPRVWVVTAMDPPAWQPVAAALLSAGPSAVACDAGAGWLLGLDGCEGPATIAVGPAANSGPGRRRRRIREVAEVHGYRCTTPLQTLADLAAILDDDDWEAALESALRRRLVALGDLPGNARGQARARIVGVLHRRGPGKPTRSMFETRVVQLCRTRPDIPEPVRGHEIRDHGRFVAEVDLCWPELGGYVECDGRAFHDGAVAFVRDRWREAQIAALLGWPRVPLTWPNLRHPRQTARKLAEFIATLRLRAPTHPPSE